MTILVAGATGNTGRPLVEQLLHNNHKVRAIVRSPDKLSAEILENPNLTVIDANILDLTSAQMSGYVKDCDAVVSCLGHVISFQGVFGKPWKLCTDATRNMCDAIVSNQPLTPTKFILMSTVAVKNPDHAEKRTPIERGLLALYRYILPPHRDNETASEYLTKTVGSKSRYVEWCSVRPTSLVDAEVSPYDVFESPVSGIFDSRPTTRANVARFMTELIDNENLWDTWKFQMPVIMNSEPRDQ